MNVLVTRPQRDGESTARQLAARGHKALLAPVLEIAGVDARPASFNIITILRAAGHDADAEQLARNLALKHLRIAVDAAADLPGRSGDLLRQSALSLAARL